MIKKLHIYAHPFVLGQTTETERLTALIIAQSTTLQRIKKGENISIPKTHSTKKPSRQARDPRYMQDSLDTAAILKMKATGFIKKNVTIVTKEKILQYKRKK